LKFCVNGVNGISISAKCIGTPYKYRLVFAINNLAVIDCDFSRLRRTAEITFLSIKVANVN